MLYNFQTSIYINTMKTNGEVDRNLRHHIFYVCLDAEAPTKQETQKMVKLVQIQEDILHSNFNISMSYHANIITTEICVDIDSSRQKQAQNPTKPYLSNLEYRSSFDHVTKFMATLNRSLVAKLRSLALVLAAPLTEKKMVFVQQLNCLILLSYLVLNQWYI